MTYRARQEEMQPDTRCLCRSKLGDHPDFFAQRRGKQRTADLPIRFALPPFLEKRKNRRLILPAHHWMRHRALLSVSQDIVLTSSLAARNFLNLGWGQSI